MILKQFIFCIFNPVHCDYSRKGRAYLSTFIHNSTIPFFLSAAQQHLSKTIEITRINLFNIITQYRAIFPEEDGNLKTQSSLRPLQGVSCNGDRLFQAWLHNKVCSS